MAQDGKHRLTLVASLISWPQVMGLFSWAGKDKMRGENAEWLRGGHAFRRDDDGRAESWEGWQ